MINTRLQLKPYTHSIRINYDFININIIYLFLNIVLLFFNSLKKGCINQHLAWTPPRALIRSDKQTIDRYMFL